MPPRNGGPHWRLSSPRGGGSTFITSAPMSASSMVHTGPERILERSTTKRSSSGFAPCDAICIFGPVLLRPGAKAYQLSGQSTAGFAEEPENSGGTHGFVPVLRGIPVGSKVLPLVAELLI